jgi:hypothetical protein
MFGWSRRRRDKNATGGGIVEGNQRSFLARQAHNLTNRLVESSTLSVIAISFTLATGFGTFHGMESRQGQNSTKPTPLEPQAPRRAGQQRKPALTAGLFLCAH